LFKTIALPEMPSMNDISAGGGVLGSGLPEAFTAEVVPSNDEWNIRPSSAAKPIALEKNRSHNTARKEYRCTI
jgi:hypothetical protein